MDISIFSRLTTKDLGDMTDKELAQVKDFGKRVQDSVDGNRKAAALDAIGFLVGGATAKVLGLSSKSKKTQDIYDNVAKNIGLEGAQTVLLGVDFDGGAKRHAKELENFADFLLRERAPWEGLGAPAGLRPEDFNGLPNDDLTNIDWSRYIGIETTVTSQLNSLQFIDQAVEYASIDFNELSPADPTNYYRNSQGLYVENKPLSYRIGEDGNVSGIAGSDGTFQNISGSFTPEQFQHYGRVQKDDFGNVIGQQRATFGQSLLDAITSFADAIGLDGKFGFDGSFNGHIPEDQRVPSDFHPVVRPPARPEFDGSRQDGYDNRTPGDYEPSGGREKKEKEYREKQEQREKDSGESSGGKPVLLDLDGDGVELTELSKSTIFMDAGGDGLLHRTAWAGAGDGVLFFDDDGDGAISEKKEYVFTEWDPTAVDDLAALRAVFDSNDDGVLDASDARFADFKVLVTNPDGSTTAKTLMELGITSINLTADTTRIELPDGSMITGQTSFTRSDGSTGTVANATLVAEAQGYRVEQDESTLAGGDRQVVSTAYTATGDVAYVITSVTSPDGSRILNSYDDDGDGVVDRLQEISTQKMNGNKIETVVNKTGSDAATAIITSRVVTTTSADGGNVTIQRDSTGGGWFDQEEVRVTLPDGSRSIVIKDLDKDGGTIRSSSESTTINGLTRTKGTDEDGDTQNDVVFEQTITEHGDGRRTEETEARNQNTSLRSSEKTVVGPDGQSRTISRDVDGDGVFETVEHLSITPETSGASSSTLRVENGNESLRSTVTQTQSADALTKTIAADVDGDGDVDRTTVDATVVHVDGSRENTITVTNTDDSVRSMQKTTLGADKVTSETWVDLDQDGVFDADERVRSVTVDGTTQDRTTLDQTRAIDGTVLVSSTTVSSEDDLTVSSTTDADGDGDTDLTVSDVTTVDGAGVSTRTIETRNQSTQPDQSLRSKTVITTSADGLTTTTRVDADGDGGFDGQTVDTRVLEADDSTTRTISSYAGDGTTLLSRSTSTESADRRVMTTEVDADGDGIADQITVSTEATDGTTTVTDTRKAANGATITSSETWISANGLVSRTARDLDGDGITDVTNESTTVLNPDGSRTQTLVTQNREPSERDKREIKVRDDGLETTTKTDADGNGIFERIEKSTTVLKQNGEQVTTHEVRSENNTLLSATQTTRSDDGLITTTRFNTDGDSTDDLVTTETTTLQNDGGTSVTSDLREVGGPLRNSTTTTRNDNDTSVVTEVDVNGDGEIDSIQSILLADSGVLTQTRTEQAADGGLQSRTETVTSANGLTVTTRADLDGNDTYERTQTATTVLNADGSRTTTTTEEDENGQAFRSSQITISDDGRTRTETWDHNGDTSDDLTVETMLNLSLDGIKTVTEERRDADTSLIRKTTTVTSADGRTVTTAIDADGDEGLDMEIRAVRDDRGEATRDTKHFASDGTVETREVRTTSGDGLESTVRIDRDGDGQFEINSTDETRLYPQGSTVRTVVHEDSEGTELEREIHEISDDGHFTRTRYDFDGDGQIDIRSHDTTTYLNNGDTSRVQETWQGSSNKLSSATWITSGNGLTITYSADADNNGHLDRQMSMSRDAAGGMTDTVSEFGTDGDLLRSMTHVISSDGRSESYNYDRDGNTIVDRTISMTTDLSRNVTVQYSDIPGIGLSGADIEVFTSANGLVSRTEFDLDGDDSTDIQFERQTTFNTTGDRIETITETMGQGQTTYREVMTTSADGLSSTTVFDMDGDQTDDGSSQSVTSLNSDGSRQTLDETRYTNGDLRSSRVTDVSRDGRTVTETFDYDGNGKDNLFEERYVATSGAETITQIGYNDDGDEISRHVTHTTADGYQTTINRNGVEEMISRSLTGNGTYTWDNGVDYSVEGEHFRVTHTIDAFGNETWKSVKTWKDSGGAIQAETHSARLDQDAIARIKDEAARIYDTVLDRDLLREESEVLVEYLTNGQLDRPALVAALTSSEEFETRYGTLSDTGFVTQMYLNSFGRGASLAELNKHLGALTGGLGRDDLAADIAESAEHLVIGNVHRITNNFDVLVNPAEYERVLDRAYVEMLIKDLVDVTYDRAATAHEVQYLSGLLMQGSDGLSDVAQMLLDLSGDIQGTAQNSVHGLTGAVFVERVFLNALERVPSAVETQTWQDHLSSGRVTQADLLAAMAQSVDHRGTGNVFETGAAPNVTITTGTTAANTLTGSNAQDDLRGLAHNDTLIGNGGADRLQGGAGTDNLRGGAGSDTYVWSRGDGSDTITDQGTSMIEVDVLHLTDVLATDVSLQRNYSSNTLIITIAGTGGAVISVASQFEETKSGGGGLETLLFSDGTTWTASDIDRNTVVNGDGVGQAETIYGVSGDDTIRGHGGNDRIEGGDGDDLLYLGANNDIGLGGDGNDQIDGWDGNDQIAGGKGDDNLRGDKGNDRIWGDEGSDTLHGGDGSDELYGGVGADSLRGNGGNDTLYGGQGNDSLRGSGGADVLDGGDGDGDLAIYLQSSVGVVVDLSTGTGAQGYAQGDTLIDVENVLGSRHADALIGDDLENELFGEAGNDTLNGNGGDDRLWGQDGDDELRGGDGNDQVFGDKGNDLLFGEGGDDYLSGGDDADRLTGGLGDDTLFGGSGADVFVSQTGDGDDLIADFDVIVDKLDLGGVSGTINTLVLEDGIRVIASQTNSVHLQGVHAGTLSLNNFTSPTGLTLNAISLSIGIDAYGTMLSALGGGLSIGTASADLMIGSESNDDIRAVDGNDIIIDGAGSDKLRGGDGSDYFKLVVDGSDDHIVDFTVGEDTLDISDWGAESLADISFEVDYDSGGVWRGRSYASVGDERVRLDGFDQATIDALTDKSFIFATPTPPDAGDIIIGTAGKDTLNGTDGNDTIYGGDGVDKFYAGLGDDLLYGGNGNDKFNETIGAKLFDGGNGADQVDYGDVQGDVTVDLATGENNQDDVFVSIEIIVGSRTGSNTLFGSASGNRLYGYDASDTLVGQGGNDRIYGGASDDRLVGGTGKDSLTGGDGRDVFGFSVGDGTDAILDFEDGLDLIELSSLTFNDLTLTQEGAHVRISYGESDSILIQNLNVASLTSADFIEKVIVDGTPENDSITVGFTDVDGEMVSGDGEVIFGFAGDDTIDAGGGDDTIDGGTGNDVLTGGSGGDTFVLAAGDGQNVIEDLSVTEDLLQFEGIQGPIEAIDGPDGVVLKLGGDNQVLLRNVSFADLEGSAALGGVQIVLEQTEPTTSYVQIGSLPVTQASSADWYAVAFDQAIENAVVVMGPPSSEGDQPLNLRVRNVTDQGFEFQVDEWDYLDGAHTEVSVSWMAGSLGSHTLSDGTLVTFGQQQMSSAAPTTVALSGFASAPIVMAQLSGNAEARALTHRLDVSVNGFDVTLQAEQAQNTGLSSIAPENLYWVALDIAAGSPIFESGQLDATHDFAAVGTTLGAPEAFFADMQTFNGIDPAALRYDLGTGGAVSVKVEEELSADTEIDHIPETVAWFIADKGVFEVGGTGAPVPPVGVNGTATDDNIVVGFVDDDGDSVTTGADTIYGNDGDDTLDGGTGDDVLTGGQGSDTFVFRVGSGEDVIEDFSLAEDLIRIDGQLPSFEVTDTAEGTMLLLGDNDQVLVKGVTAAELDGSSALAPVDVAPSGRMQIGDLAVTQADSTEWHTVLFDQTIENAAVVMGPASSEGDQPLNLRVRNVTDQGFEFQVDEWDYLDGAHTEVSVSWMAGSLGNHTLSDGTEVTFGQQQVNSAAPSTVALNGFASAPIVMAQLSGDAEARALTHRLENVSATGFDFTLQAEQAQNGTLSTIATEQLYWVALDIAAGSTIFESGQLDVTHEFTSTGTTLDADEAFFADMQTLVGPDPAGVRYDLGATGAVSVKVEEELSADDEINHAVETIAWITANEGMFDFV